MNRVLLGLVLVIGLCSAQTFDGVIRANTVQPGRADAYLVPPYPSSHASFIEYVQGTGGLIVAWFSGTGEGQSGVGIATSLLPANKWQVGGQWTNGTVISRQVGYAYQNPVVFCSGGNNLYAFHTSMPAPPGIEAQAKLFVLNSTDGGATWEGPNLLFNQNGTWDRNRIILSLDGTWLFPIYHSNVGDDNSFMLSKPANLPVESPASWTLTPLANTTDLIQPTLIRPVPGNPFLRIYYRDENQKSIYTATSSDDGKTFTGAVPSVLPNNNSGISACTLASGNVAMVYNPMTSGRNILVISLSLDNGLSWKYTRYLENATAGEFSYPSLLQTADSNIHVTYTYLRETIKYSIINEDWIKAAN